MRLCGGSAAAFGSTASDRCLLGPALSGGARAGAQDVWRGSTATGRGGGQPHTCVGKQTWDRACGCTAETHGYVCVCVRAFWDVVDEWDSGSVCVESFGDLSFESFGRLGF